ncbi:MAG: NAD-dependent epimerase/dehydratase family protein [Gammaproteobacteria bacterium]
MSVSHNNFRDSVVAVTGATGFIGGHLAARLCALGAVVHGIGRSAQSFEHGQFHSWTLDLSDYKAVEGAVRSIKPDYVFHLASHVMGAPDLKHVLPAFYSNLESSVNLMTACAESGHGQNRIVFSGSLVEPSPGDLETVPSSPYAAAKWASGSYARMFHALYGLPTSIARVFMVYGPAQRDETKLVPYVVRSLLAGKAPKITSGQRLIDWIYVTDVVDGFLAIAAAKGVEGQSVDLGSGQLIATRAFVLRIAELMQAAIRPEFGALPDRPLEPVRTADIERSYQQTGWRPRVALDQGLHEVIAYYRGLGA